MAAAEKATTAAAEATAAAADKVAAEKATTELEWAIVVEQILWKPQEERTTAEKAIHVVEELVRNHREGTAATRKAAIEEAGSNMKRYEEIKERFEKCDDGDEEEWGAISREAAW